MTQWVIEGDRTPAPAPPPPLEQVIGRGIALGALGGLAFLGLESAILGWLGLPPAVWAVPLQVLLLYAVTGAIAGGVAALSRLEPGGWAALTMFLALAWLVTGHVGLLIVEAGGWAWIALPFLFALAWLVGIGLASAFEDATAVGIATATFVAAVGLLSINLHLVAPPISPVSIAINGGILVLAPIIGGLAAMVYVDRVLGIPGLLALTGGVAWVAALPVLSPQTLAWPEADRDAGPPLVLVVVDGLRPDHLGVYGYPRATSPNLDAVAARRGLVYADASTAAPWSLPAVGSLMTGRVPSRHGAGLNPPGRTRRVGLGSVPTLAEALDERGYATAGITSSPLLSRAYGFRRGCGAYDDRVGPAFTPVALHPWTTLGLEVLTWPGHREAEAITDRALSFLALQEAPSWFLFVHYVDVAQPGSPLEADPAVVADQSDPLIARYDAAIHRLDRSLGRLLEALPEDAWVVLTASHGAELRDRRPLPVPVPVGTRFGHHVYQELLRVPLVVLGPVTEPRWVERPVPTLDVTATLLALAEATPPSGLEGEPLREVVGGEPAEGERLLIAEAVRYGPEVKAARRGRWKIIRSADGTRLYDLTLDPRELSPIREADRERQIVVRELERLLPRP